MRTVEEMAAELFARGHGEDFAIHPKYADQHERARECFRAARAFADVRQHEEDEANRERKAGAIARALLDNGQWLDEVTR